MFIHLHGLYHFNFRDFEVIYYRVWGRRVFVLDFCWIFNIYFWRLFLWSRFFFWRVVRLMWFFWLALSMFQFWIFIFWFFLALSGFYLSLLPKGANKTQCQSIDFFDFSTFPSGLINSYIKSLNKRNVLPWLCIFRMASACHNFGYSSRNVGRLSSRVLFWNLLQAYTKYNGRATKSLFMFL